MNFNRNYGTGKYNECKKIQCSFICRLYRAIEYMSSKSGYYIQNKRENNENNNKAYGICRLPPRDSKD